MYDVILIICVGLGLFFSFGSFLSLYQFLTDYSTDRMKLDKLNGKLDELQKNQHILIKKLVEDADELPAGNHEKFVEDRFFGKIVKITEDNFEEFKELIKLSKFWSFDVEFYDLDALKENIEEFYKGYIRFWDDYTLTVPYPRSSILNNIISFEEFKQILTSSSSTPIEETSAVRMDNHGKVIESLLFDKRVMVTEENFEEFKKLMKLSNFRNIEELFTEIKDILTEYESSYVRFWDGYEITVIDPFEYQEEHTEKLPILSFEDLKQIMNISVK